MMKVFKLEIGNILLYAAADSLEDMVKRKADVDATFAFLPVEITELVIEGYEVTATPLDDAKDEDKPKNRGGRPPKVKE